ncbi:MAG: fumarylacetoacetate hydrolase family protein, partial [Clostridia bacterium]
MKITAINCNGERRYAKVYDGKYYQIDGDIFGEFHATNLEIFGERLVPVIPTKIVALGANYPKHNNELNEKVLTTRVLERKVPLIFLKPPSSLLSDGGTIVLPRSSANVHYEGELAVIIKSHCKNISAVDASKYILGYTCANDVSDRTIQNEDLQWTRAKGFDTFCPLGSAIETDFNASNARIKTILNGVTVQDGNINDMIFGVNEAVDFISHCMSLEKGDVILMGTPAGVGALSEGD